MYSPKSFIVLPITFRSMNHFELIFLLCELGVQVHSCAWGYLVVPVSFVEYAILSPIELTWHPCR